MSNDAVEKVPEHSDNASCLVVFKLKVILQRSPDGFNDASVLDVMAFKPAHDFLYHFMTILQISRLEMKPVVVQCDNLLKAQFSFGASFSIINFEIRNSYIRFLFTLLKNMLVKL